MILKVVVSVRVLLIRILIIVCGIGLLFSCVLSVLVVVRVMRMMIVVFGIWVVVGSSMVRKGRMLLFRNVIVDVLVVC